MDLYHRVVNFSAQVQRQKTKQVTSVRDVVIMSQIQFFAVSEAIQQIFYNI